MSQQREVRSRFSQLNVSISFGSPPVNVAVCSRFCGALSSKSIKFLRHAGFVSRSPTQRRSQQTQARSEKQREATSKALARRKISFSFNEIESALKQNEWFNMVCIVGNSCFIIRSNRCDYVLFLSPHVSFHQIHPEFDSWGRLRGKMRFVVVPGDSPLMHIQLNLRASRH